MLTKSQTRTMIRALLPDSESQVWTGSTLDVLTQMVMDELWSGLIDQAMWFGSQLDSIGYTSIVAPGTIDLTSSGPLTKRFYRIQKVTSNNQEYSEGDIKDVVIFNNIQVSAPRWIYTVVGSLLTLYPLQTTCPVEVRYSFLPPAFTALGDDSPVAWVEGFEAAFIHEVVARASMTDAISTKNHAIALKSYDRLLSRVVREYVGPSGMQGTDDSIAWSGT